VKEAARSIGIAKRLWRYRNIRDSPGSGPAVGASYDVYTSRPCCTTVCFMHPPPPLKPLVNLRHLIYVASFSVNAVWLANVHLFVLFFVWEFSLWASLSDVHRLFFVGI
jgi:hypothetical protein